MLYYDRAWFIRLYGEITPSFREWIIDSTGVKIMLYLVYTTISRVDHARYEVPYAQKIGNMYLGTVYSSTFCAPGINVKCGTGKNVNPGFDSKSRHLKLYQRKVMSEKLIMDLYSTGR